MIFDQYFTSLCAIIAATARCYQRSAAGPWQVVTLITGSKRQSLLMAGDNDEVFMTRNLNVTLKKTEQYSILRSGKSEPK